MGDGMRSNLRTYAVAPGKLRRMRLTQGPFIKPRCRVAPLMTIVISSTNGEAAVKEGPGNFRHQGSRLDPDWSGGFEDVAARVERSQAVREREVIRTAAMHHLEHLPPGPPALNTIISI